MQPPTPIWWVLPPSHQRILPYMSMASQVGHTPRSCWTAAHPSSGQPWSLPSLQICPFPATCPLVPVVLPVPIFFPREGSQDTESISNSQKAAWKPYVGQWIVTRDTQSMVGCAPEGWPWMDTGRERTGPGCVPQWIICREGADVARASTCFLLAPKSSRTSS